MKNFKTALIYALIVTVVINGFGFFIGAINSSLESMVIEFSKIAKISIPIFFVPAFLSVIFYKKDVFNTGLKGLKHFFLPLLISSVLVYLIVLFNLYSSKNISFGALNRVARSNAFLSIIIFVFSSLIIYLKNVNTSKNTKALNLKPSASKVFFIFIFVATAFNLLLYFMGNPSWTYLSTILRIFISGLLIALISFLSFSFVFREEKKSKSKIILIYITTTLLMPVLMSLFGPNFSSDLFLMKFKVIFSIISPYFLMLTLAIHTYFIYLINKQEKQNLKQIGVEASLKYQQLKSQISPHFLFNNISVLTGLIEEDQEKAVRFSEDLSKVYRYFLDQETQDLVTLEDELSFAKKYIDLLKVRFENALIFNNKIEETQTFYILPMALQQVFENVVKHNALSEEEPVTITMIIENDFLVVSNTLHPKLSIETSKPSGLENIKNRYAYFTDEKMMIIKDNNLFTIKLPLLKPEV